MKKTTRTKTTPKPKKVVGKTKRLPKVGKNKISVKKTPKKVGKLTIVKKVKIVKVKATKSNAKTMNKIWVEVLMKDPRVRKWLVQAIGEHSIHVIQEFSKELSDEDIAKKSELRASEVRVVLNRLHANGLASYTRSRDKNSGWYSYIWRLDEKAANHLAEGVRVVEEIQQIGKVDGEEKYYCEVDGQRIIYTFDQAVENSFKCPQTGQPLKYLE